MKVEPVLPSQGLHVLHLFFQFSRARWEAMDAIARGDARVAFVEEIARIRALPRTQLLAFSVVGARAQLGFMLLTPDLQEADQASRRLAQSLGPDTLTLAFSYLSLTELSEYMTTEEEYARTLREEGLEEGSAAFLEKMEGFRARMAKYRKDRLDPQLPAWPVVCFYPMSKRRSGNDNWYLLDFSARKKLMGGHARVGRNYAGRVLQLITGSTGLDDWEWGVTLFSRSTSEIKDIVYEMRFDEVSARFAEFGPFFIGLQMPVENLLERLGL